MAHKRSTPPPPTPPTTASFLATFPATQSAIKITGNGEGMRIQLDIPEIELADSLALIGMRECVLRVTVTKEE